MNIFCTVGSQLPFDRLVRTVHESFAGRHDEFKVTYQIGVGAEFQPPQQAAEMLSNEEYLSSVLECDLMIAHAGMGSILTALEQEKPILVMPRRGDLNETRNDHQVYTARQLDALNMVNVSMDECELVDKLRDLSCLSVHEKIGPMASSNLLARLQCFIDSVD